MVIPVLVPSLSVFRHVKKRCKKEPKICTHIKKNTTTTTGNKQKHASLNTSLFLLPCVGISFLFSLSCVGILKKGDFLITYAVIVTQPSAKKKHTTIKQINLRFAVLDNSC